MQMVVNRTDLAIVHSTEKFERLYVKFRQVLYRSGRQKIGL